MTPLSPGDAVDAVLSVVTVQPAVEVAATDALGFATADDIMAPFPLPRWTNAAMDGYAVHGDDLRGASPEAPTRLRVVATVAAGDRPAPLHHPTSGEAARIFTGAPVPASCDSVVRQEDTSRDADAVLVHSARDAFANVRRAGGDLDAGDLVLAEGGGIGAHQLALLLAFAFERVRVHRKPRVGILSTGNELALPPPLGSPAEATAIRNGEKLADVNSAVLAALVEEAGGTAQPHGIVPDEPEALGRAIAAATDADFIITAGGASVGDHDYARQTMMTAAAALRFDRVLVRPGGPTALAVLPDGRAWLALPGNPVSAMVTFELFARPAIRRMAGFRSVHRERCRVRLATDARREPKLEQYLRCTLDRRDGADLPMATLTGSQGSGVLTSMARAEALVRVPPGPGTLSAGSVVDAIRFGTA